jgi:hypothetical protein
MKTRIRTPLVLALLGPPLLHAAALAQDPGRDPRRETTGRLPARPTVPRDFGVGNRNILAIPAASFLPMTSAETWQTLNPGFTVGGYVRALSDDREFVAGVSLPEGALIRNLVLYYDDLHATKSVIARLFALSGWNDANVDSTEIASALSPAAGAPGKGLELSAFISHTVENTVLLGGAHYVAYVFCPEGSSFRAVEVWWERQMSEAPTTPTFGDVPTTHLFYQAIEALAASEITSGCGGGNFCPNQPVTRGEVAKLLARALGLAYDNDIDFSF